MWCRGSVRTSARTEEVPSARLVWNDGDGALCEPPAAGARPAGVLSHALKDRWPRLVRVDFCRRAVAHSEHSEPHVHCREAGALRMAAGG